MKAKLLLAGLLVLAGPLAFSQELKENQRWIEQVDGGFLLPASPAASSAYNTGWGADIAVGYRFNRQFSLAGDLGHYDCDQKVLGANGGEWLYDSLLAIGRYNFGSGWVRPFVLLGVGGVSNTYSWTVAPAGNKTSQKNVDLMLAPGAGVLFVVTGDMALYVQGRLDMIFNPAGGPGSPFTDSPTMFIPLKMGLSIFASK